MATLVQGIRQALNYGEEYLGFTDVFGKDVGPPLGGIFTAARRQTSWSCKSCANYNQHRTM